MRQALHFKLFRSGQFGVYELAVLTYINSFSTYCAPSKLELMANNLGMSERKLRYVINDLCLKGILKKTYRAYKRVRLELVSLGEQAKLMGFGMIAKVLGKRTDRHRTAISDRHRDTEPIQNKTIQNKTFNTNYIYEEKIKGLMPINDVWNMVLRSKQAHMS